MGLFRRTESCSSSKSRRSTNESLFDSISPRSSTDTNDLAETVVLEKIISKPQTASILSLPIELIQQITSYLDTATSASFSLSSRYIYYALGTEHLSNHINSSKSRFEKRKTIESIVERAFPGHWFCAWCDKFHPWTLSDTPITPIPFQTRECAEYNSYLHAPSYTLRYHHIRLAIAHSQLGPSHGLPLSAFTHSTSNTSHRISKQSIPTTLTIAAKITQGSLFLHTTFTLLLPTRLINTNNNKSLLPQIWRTLPHILAHHRDSPNGHTGLMAAIDNTMRRNWTYLFTQMCADCATDWHVACHSFPHASGGYTRLVVQTWRDLGAGRNPFDAGWRAHGVCSETGILGKGVIRQGRRGKGVQAGDVRRGFESGDRLERVERAVSPVRERIYRAFMRRGMDEDEDAGNSGDVDTDVRRSRARPRAWRTGSENEEVGKREEEERVEVARQVVENLVRLDAERWRS